jgi:hypothetical protein
MVKWFLRRPRIRKSPDISQLASSVAAADIMLAAGAR